MEAVRPLPSAVTHPHEEHLLSLDDDSDLPPPPSAFPDLLTASSSSGAEQRRTAYANLSVIQQSCVQTLSTLLPDAAMVHDPLEGRDQQLAGALTQLLEVCYELETFQPPTPPITSLSTSASSSSLVDIHTSYAALTQHLLDLQSAAQSRGSTSAFARPSPSELHPAVSVVREELAWARVQSLSHAVLQLVRGRNERVLANKLGISKAEESYNPFISPEDLTADDALPPSYSQHEHEHGDDETDRTSLPGYHDFPSSEASHHPTEKGAKNVKGQTSSVAEVTPSVPTSREKMISELDALTDAIERLYTVAPQLNDQRVQMRGSTSRSRQLSEREKMRELEEIWDRIERAHGKRRLREDDDRADHNSGQAKSALRRERFMKSLSDQTSSSRLDGQDSTMRSLDAALARARDLRDRDHFLRDVVNQSAVGRLGDQDAVAPEDVTARQKQQAFITDIISRSRAGRLDGQDFPQSIEDKLAQHRDNFFNNILEASCLGRLHSQDSLPPTPKTQTDGMEDPMELVTVQDFFKSRRGSEPTVRPGSFDGAEVSKPPTALKKIARIVSLRSLGLGLKTTNGPDLTSVSYVAEHQENLRTVQIMLHGAAVSLKDDLQLETPSFTSPGNEVREAIVASKKDPSMSLRLSLPFAVYPAQAVSFAHQDLHLESKLSALPSSPSDVVSSLNSIVQHALSASDLSELRPKGVCCSACAREVADLTSSTIFKDLPSEHWAEMMEVWMCHADPTFTSRLAQQTRDGFWPTRDTVLVGGSYLLVDETQAKKHNLRIEETKADPWQVISCACGEMLGKQRSDDGRPGRGTLRFSKWAIGLLRDDDDAETIEPVRFPFSVFVVSDMLELAQAHASYRFVISEEESDKKRLLIWLFNPSVRITYRKASSSPMPSPLRSSFTNRGGEFSKLPSANIGASSAGPMASFLWVAKIMYKVLDPQDMDSGEVIPGFGPGAQMEQLSYPRALCIRLVATLRDSTTVYPVARRMMGSFDVGFLERV